MIFGWKKKAKKLDELVDSLREVIVDRTIFLIQLDAAITKVHKEAREPLRFVFGVEEYNEVVEILKSTARMLCYTEANILTYRGIPMVADARIVGWYLKVRR